MKRLLVLPVLLLTLLVENPASTADFQKGWDAYSKNDYATTLKEWAPLAEQGNADAQNNVGWISAEGSDVPQHDKTLVKWYTLAAKQGLALAHFNLGVMHYAGRGVVIQDHIYAHVWWSLTASQGDENAKKYRNLVEEKMFPHKLRRQRKLHVNVRRKITRGVKHPTSTP